jgi:hypothetical protein
MTYVGSCFCGAVQLAVEGEPEGMGYCHCSLWKPEAVKVTSGAEHVTTFTKSPASERQYCAQCGGHLMTNHPSLGVVDVFAATLPTLKFVPGVHINYAETVLPMRDGLPKLRDFPADFGGSGEAIPE